MLDIIIIKLHYRTTYISPMKYNNHIEDIKNTRRLRYTYISIDFIVLLVYYRLSGGEGGIRTHGPLRSHWFSRPAP